ncbi:hypothetical protein AAIB48_01995 [Paraclostridium benzoelyticum]|uniref:hypothetical protein n=1 Tax=Paraclostridium benzoelyticum TaxID=1629550 RepID=UPI0031CD5774
MYNFEIKTKISCGIGALESLKDITNKKIFIITDPFMIESKTIDKILINLEGNDCNIFSEIVPSSNRNSCKRDGKNKRLLSRYNYCIRWRISN